MSDLDVDLDVGLVVGFPFAVDSLFLLVEAFGAFFALGALADVFASNSARVRLRLLALGGIVRGDMIVEAPRKYVLMSN